MAEAPWGDIKPLYRVYIISERERERERESIQNIGKTKFPLDFLQHIYIILTLHIAKIQRLHETAKFNAHLNADLLFFLQI